MKILVLLLGICLCALDVRADALELMTSAAYLNSGVVVDDAMRDEAPVQILYDTGTQTAYVYLEENLVLEGSFTEVTTGHYHLGGYDSTYGDVDVYLDPSGTSGEFLLALSATGKIESPAKQWQIDQYGEISYVPPYCVCFTLAQGESATRCTVPQCRQGAECEWNGEVPSAYCEMR